MNTHWPKIRYPIHQFSQLGMYWVFEFYLLSEHLGCRWSRMTPFGQTQRVNFISRFKAIHNAPKSEQLAWKIDRENGLLDQTKSIKKNFLQLD